MSDDNNSSPRYFYAVGALFKNEAGILDEWIAHYIDEGAEHFYLIDNGSTDNYHPIIDKYSDYITLFVDTRRHVQTECYNTFILNRHRKDIEWLAIVDLDEFVYSRNGFSTTADYLKSVPEDVSAVSVAWKMFGSNGWIEQPKSGVVANFTQRKCDVLDHFVHQKQISRVKNVLQLDIHDSQFPANAARKIKPDGSPFVCTATSNYYAAEEYIESHNLHMNHYAIQSYDWFCRVKKTRGDSNSITNEHVRDEKYFKEYDTNDTKDTELREKKK